MREYRIENNIFKFLEKWIHQNNAEIIDIIDGCLLDSLLYETKNGIALFLETYATPNSSVYTLYFGKTEKERAAVWETWENMNPPADYEY